MVIRIKNLGLWEKIDWMHFLYVMNIVCGSKEGNLCNLIVVYVNNRARASNKGVLRLIMMFSLDARLVMYTNRTINPPKKIKNSTKESHLNFVCKKILTLMVRACVRIRIINITG
jgi:hypothetical protein